MRTLLTMIFALCTLFAVNASAIITNPFSNSYNNAGTVSHYDRVFVNVKNNYTGTSTLNTGDVVIVDTTSDDGIIVASTTTATARPHCMIDATISAGAVGKCLVWGYTDKLNVDVTSRTDAVAAGGIVLLGATTAGTVRGYALTNGDVATMPAIGVFLDAETASGRKEAFIDLL